ncbi:putative NADH-ubiquinone oxidoreductase chain 4L-like [Capsicum annuum]|nr:putative NADH-ubiquinone oxidoreductase chain 4L-like [Capsicum annuum]
MRIAPFADYALLGGDILITNIKVVEQYKKLLDRLGVTISESKSIIFDNGTIKFAKSYWTKSMQVDLSPISLRLEGAKYRVHSSLYSTQSKRWERLKAAARKPGRSHPLPLEYWIGRFGNLNPYLKGKLVDYLRTELKPKEIRLFPRRVGV